MDGNDMMRVSVQRKPRDAGPEPGRASTGGGDDFDFITCLLLGIGALYLLLGLAAVVLR